MNKIEKKFQLKQLNQMIWLVLIGTGVVGSGQVFAAGTIAGTTIDNAATLTFAVGGTTQPTIGSSPTGNESGAGSPTSFVVDRKLNLTVTTVDTAPVSTTLGNNFAVTSFNVTNSSNAQINVLLSTISNLASGANSAYASLDNSDFMTSCSIHGSLADAQTNANPINSLSDVAIDATLPAFVRCNTATALANISPVPPTFADANGLINVNSLVGQAAGATTQTTANGNPTSGNSPAANVAYTQDTGADVVNTIQNVFADQAGGSATATGSGTTNNGAGDATDTYRDGKHSSNSAYILAMPILSVLKSEQLICDPLNGASNPKHIPGAVVKYTITVSNDASATASGFLTSLSDPLDSNLTFDPDFLLGNSTANCIAGGAPSNAAGSGFRISNVSSNTTSRPAGPIYTSNTVDPDATDYTSPNVNVDYAKAMPAGAPHVQAEIKPGESITVEFQAIVN